MLANTEKFTQKTNEVLELAQKVAIKLNHAKIEGEHLHYALLTVDGSLVSNVLSAMGIDVKAVTAALYDQLEKIPKVYGDDVQLSGTRRLNQLFIYAEDEAKRFNDDYVSVEHLYLALLGERNSFSTSLFNRFNKTLKNFS